MAGRQLDHCMVVDPGHQTTEKTRACHSIAKRDMKNSEEMERAGENGKGMQRKEGMRYNRVEGLGVRCEMARL